MYYHIQVFLLDFGNRGYVYGKIILPTIGKTLLLDVFVFLFDLVIYIKSSPRHLPSGLPKKIIPWSISKELRKIKEIKERFNVIF